MSVPAWCKKGAFAKTPQGALGVVADVLETYGEVTLALAGGEESGYIKADTLVQARPTDAGYDALAPIVNGTPALASAAARGDLKVLEILHGVGANLEARMDNGFTALIQAANNGQPDCAEALLRWGADVDAADKEGDTALHRAAENGQLECARLLVRAGADRAKRNEKGKSALEVAQEEA
eukprot:COSAG04_NODE_8263_length_999_cov_2.725556_1_plen_180_part_01